MGFKQLKSRAASAATSMGSAAASAAAEHGEKAGKGAFTEMKKTLAYNAKWAKGMVMGKQEKVSEQSALTRRKEQGELGNFLATSSNPFLFLFSFLVHSFPPGLYFPFLPLTILQEEPPPSRKKKKKEEEKTEEKITQDDLIQPYEAGATLLVTIVSAEGLAKVSTATIMCWTYFLISL